MTQVLQYTPIQQNILKIVSSKKSKIAVQNLVKELDKPRVTVLDNLKKLENVLICEKVQEKRKGRPRIFVQLRK